MSPFKYAESEATRDRQPVEVSKKPLSKPDMVRNTDGAGYVFKLDALKQLDRFLILGTESPTYYATSKKLTESNIKNITKLIQEDPQGCLERILEISVEGRAPKNDPAIFALSLFFKYASPEWKYKASMEANKVLRTFTHLATFMEYVTQFHGQGRSVRRLMSRWYTERAPEQVLYQYTKYSNRNGWAHKDIVHLAHVKPTTEQLQALFSHMFGKTNDSDLAEVFPQYQSDIDLRQISSVNEALTIIRNNPRVQWEQIPTQFLKEGAVWEALLPNMGMTALIRSLGRMSAAGVFGSTLSASTKTAISRLTNKEELKKAMIHPIQALTAWSTYGKGYSVKGKTTWNTNSRILAALEETYLLSFSNAPKTGLNYYIGVDTSGSMTCGEVCGIPGMRPIDAAACIAHERVMVEDWVEVVGFSHTLTKLKLNKSDNLNTAIRKVANGQIGSTNPGLLIEDALKHRYPVDVFIMVTDNEVNHGKHPFMLLKKFRQQVNPKAKLVVIGLTATGFTLADPSDGGMLDIVGFDSSAPSLIAEFAMKGL